MRAQFRSPHITTAARYGAALLLVISVTFLLSVTRDQLTPANFSVVYLLIVIIVAVRQGTGPSLVAAVVGFLAFNFFLTRPLYTFLVADPREVLDLLVFLLVALITGRLASQATSEAENARQRAAEQDVLLKLTSAFNQLTEPQAVYASLQAVLRDDLGARESRILPEANVTPPSHNTVYAALQAGGRVYGTLRVSFAAAPAPRQMQMVTACALHAASALQRIELTQRAQQSQTFEEADRLKTALLHAVSHDLRTPLTIMKSSIGNLLSLRGGLSDEQQREMLQILDAEADALNALIEDLLDMSRLQAGALHLNTDWNSLEEIAGDIAAQVWQRTKEERLRLDFPDDMPLVRCDYGLMLRAMSNLVDNALRYEPEGRQVEIRGQSDAESVSVAVVNHGPPLSQEERTRITEPFYHGKDGHIGLGMAIARGIVEAHQGRLAVEDTPGGGVTFTCILPHEGESSVEAPDRR